MAVMTTDPPCLPRLHASTRALLVVVAVGMSCTIATRALAGAGVLPDDAVPTELLVLLLVLGTVVMLGNVIVTQAWAFMAERSGDRRALRFAGQAVNRADVVLAAEISFITAGVVWIGLLVPLQNRLAVRAQADLIDRVFLRTMHLWYAAGITATLLTILAVGFAVLQPEL